MYSIGKERNDDCFLGLKKAAKIIVTNRTK